MAISVLIAFLNPGPLEISVIGLISLLLFGPRVPRMMRFLGRSLVEFKRGTRDTDVETVSGPELSGSRSGRQLSEGDAESAASTEK